MPHPPLRTAVTKQLEVLVSEYHRFHVSLGFNRGFDLPRAQVQRICSSIVGPLCAEADEVLIYGQEDTPVFRKFAANVERSRGKYRLLRDRDTVTAFEDYWGAYRGERGTVLFLLRCPDSCVRSLMSKTQDPGFLENPYTIASRSAFRYAKAAQLRSEDTMAFILSANQGLETLFVVAHPERSRACLRLALSHCEFTPRYLLMYGAASK